MNIKQLALAFPDTGSGPKYEIKEDLSALGAGLGGWQFGSGSDTPATILNIVITYLFPVAGLILLGMLVAGGFTIFLSAGNAEKTKKGQGMIVNALVGFLVIFAAYWIIQIIENTFGLYLIS